MVIGDPKGFQNIKCKSSINSWAIKDFAANEFQNIKCKSSIYIKCNEDFIVE